MYLAIIIIINIIWILNICNFNAVTELEVGGILQLRDNYFQELSMMLPTMQMLSSFSQISCLGKGESLGMPFLEHLHDTPLTQATLLMTDGLQVAVNTRRDKDCLTGTMMARNSYCTQPQLQKTNKK